MNYFGIMIEFILCFIEIAIFFGFGYKFLGIKDIYQWYHRLLFFFSAVTIASAISYTISFSGVKTVLILLILFSYTFILFEGDKKKKFLYLMLFLIMFVSAEILATLIMTLSQNTESWRSIMESQMSKVAVFCIQKIIFALFFTVASYYKFADNNLVLPSNHWFVFLISFSTILVITIFFMHFGYDNSDSFYSKISIILILSLVSIYFAIYYFFYHMNIYFKKSNEQTLIAYQNEMIEKYILQKEESDKMVKILSHDLKHNLIRWRQVAKIEGHGDLLSEITEYEKLLASNKIVDTGNDIANAIFNPKLLYARKNGIDFEIQGVLQEGLVILPTELCSLLGNLVDNAIEATIKVSDTGKRRIFLTMKRKNAFLFLEIENTYEDEPVMQNGDFITWKTNKGNHGIGLISIKSLIDKYEGAIENTFENHVFKSIIMLRAYDF